MIIRSPRRHFALKYFLKPNFPISSFRRMKYFISCDLRTFYTGNKWHLIRFLKIAFIAGQIIPRLPPSKSFLKSFFFSDINKLWTGFKLPDLNIIDYSGLICCRDWKSSESFYNWLFAIIKSNWESFLLIIHFITPGLKSGHTLMQN